MYIFNDVYVYFEDKDEENIFHKFAQDVTKEESQTLNTSNTLNHDYIGNFKKTAIIIVVNHILEYLQSKIVIGEKTELLTNFLSILLLAIADPTFLYKEQRLLEDKKEFFSRMKLFFKLDKFGTMYIDNEKLKEIFVDEDISKFLEEMERFKIVHKDGERYTVNEDIVIKHIKV